MSMWYDSNMRARKGLEKNNGSSGWIDIENIEEMDFPHLYNSSTPEPQPKLNLTQIIKSFTKRSL